MVAWLIVSLKTQTFGPNADTFASGQIDGDPVAAAAAAGDIAATNPAPVTSAAAARTERHRRAAGRPRVILFISAAFAPQPWEGPPPQFPEIGDRAPKSALNLTLTLLTRRKHHRFAIKKTLTN
jgi:hypothetical protein